MSEMVERVAKAIMERDFMGESDIGELESEALAIAAIKAMREPSVHMLAAAYRTVGIPEKPILANSFRAMIDEALK